jgi:hypothetical protein
MRLVSRKMPPNTSTTIPKIPVTVCVKYRVKKISANKALITLSVVFIFFFMGEGFVENVKLHFP